MSRRFLTLPTLILISAALLAAEPSGLRSAAEILGSEHSLIEAEGKAIHVAEDGAVTLLPRHPAADAFRAAIASEKPALLVEALFVLPRTGPSTKAGRSEELAAIYGLLGSFNSLEGIEYWSASRKTWRTFYAESYRVDGSETKRRISDPPAPKPGAVPLSEETLVFQRDLSFGANLYRYSFRGYDAAVSLESTNLTMMSYSIVPVLAVGALKTRLLVFQTSDAILFYAASGADVPGVFRGKLRDSFSNRAEALFRWFTREAKSLLAHG
jgi:hypothetical protein